MSEQTNLNELQAKADEAKAAAQAAIQAADEAARAARQAQREAEMEAARKADELRQAKIKASRQPTVDQIQAILTKLVSPEKRVSLVGPTGGWGEMWSVRMGDVNLVHVEYDNRGRIIVTETHKDYSNTASRFSLKQNGSYNWAGIENKINDAIQRQILARLHQQAKDNDEESWLQNVSLLLARLGVTGVESRKAYEPTHSASRYTPRTEARVSGRTADGRLVSVTRSGEYSAYISLGKSVGDNDHPASLDDIEQVLNSSGLS